MTMDRTRQLRGMIAAHQRAAEGETLESVTNLESAGGGDFSRDQAEAVLDRIVRQAQALAERARPDREEFSEALKTLRAHAPAALKKLVGKAGEPVGELSPDEQASLEAVVIADGSRLSFLLDTASRHYSIPSWASGETWWRRIRKLSPVSPKRSAAFSHDTAATDGSSAPGRWLTKRKV